MSGLSPDPRRRRRQLENLQRGRQPAPPAPEGNRRAVSHGAFATIAADRLDAKALEVFAALAADAPMRAADGGLHAADGALVKVAADCMCRLDDVAANIRDFGAFHQSGKRKGDPRTVLAIEATLRRELADHLDALGMSPRSRAKLGVDLARTQHFDLAKHYADSDVIDGDADAA